MSSKKLVKITKCRSCNGKNLEDILSLGDQYLSDFLKTNKKPEKYPLDLILCNDCNLLQLRHNAPQSSLYTERYGYRSGINQTMKDELKLIVTKSLEKHENLKGLVAVDIGANDGTLLSNYPKKIHRIAVEPIKKLAKDAKEYSDIVVNDFFTYEAINKKAKGIKADIITVISCFYDMEDPNKFVADLKKILNKNGVIVIQQNYLVGMLEQNAFDNIVHEHLEYYSLLSLENLLKRHGLQVFDVEMTPLNGGSFRTFISAIGDRKEEKSVIKLREKEKALKLNKKAIYKQFAKRVIDNKKTISELIQKLVKNKKKVYLYGASTRGNTLLQYYNLDNTLITAAAERNPEKWGRKIASVGVPIISESQARKEKPDYMLVLPWFFKEEFLRRENSYLDSGGHFIFPLPKVKII